jgi:hypothetical protein
MLAPPFVIASNVLPLLKLNRERSLKSTTGTAEQSSVIDRAEVAEVFVTQPDPALPDVRKQTRKHERAVRLHHRRVPGCAGEDDPPLITRRLPFFMLHNDVAIEVRLDGHSS